MTNKTQKPSGKLGLMRNQKQIDDSLQRRPCLTQSLKDTLSAELIPASWAVEVSRVGGIRL